MTAEKDAPGLADFAAPTESAPQTIGEMVERRKELDAGKNIASLHKYARMYIPGLRSKLTTMLVEAEDRVDTGLLRRALSFMRGKAGIYKQVLTDQELRKAQQVYTRMMSLFETTNGNPDIPPNEALAIVNECYRFVQYLLDHYSDKRGLHATEEIYLLLDLAGLAAAQYGWWSESAGYTMPYKKWVEMGRPNVNSAVPADAKNVISSKENSRVSKGSEAEGLTEQEVLAGLPKIDTPEGGRGDFLDLIGGVKTRGGSDGKVPTS